ncbi:hypothetical protein HYW20_02720 [Candidatus Woesearchaeota archaeon]|nr:hypothetical protein [Candidatus Woesearchaeota archaeon]
MARFKLVPYSIRIRNKHSDKNLDLTKIPTNKGDVSFFTMFEKLCKDYNSDVYERKKEQKTLCVVNSVPINTKNIISGTIKSGEYGFEADFFDTKLRKRMQSARKEEYSEELPFFFLFHIPKKNVDIGFIILEKFKQYGIKIILQKVLTEILEKHNKDLIIEVNPLISEKLLNILKSSEKLIEIKFLKKEVPKDVADKNLIKNYEDISEEHSFKIKRNKEIILNIKDEIEKALKNVDYPYSEIQNEKYDEVRLIVKRDGTTSTISLEDVPRFRECMPISPKTSDLERGFPKEAYLYNKSKEYLNNILKSYDEEVMEE